MREVVRAERESCEGGGQSRESHVRGGGTFQWYDLTAPLLGTGHYVRLATPTFLLLNE